MRWLWKYSAIELKDALKIHSKGISAALPSETKYDNLNSNALNALDFINIMSYDFTGPWNPSKPGQHSSFYHAQRGINFWKNTIGIPGEKLTLGVPFYGYDFKNSTTVESFKYGSIVASNKSKYLEMPLDVLLTAFTLTISWLTDNGATL